MDRNMDIADENVNVMAFGKDMHAQRVDVLKQRSKQMQKTRSTKKPNAANVLQESVPASNNTGIKSNELSNNKRKLKDHQKKSTLPFAIFHEEEDKGQRKIKRARKRRLSTDSLDLVQNTTSIGNNSAVKSDASHMTSNSFVALRQQLINQYEQQIRSLKEESESKLAQKEAELLQMAEKFKTRDNEAYYFSFMYEAAKEQIDELEATISQSKDKETKAHEAQVKLAKQLALKQSKIVQLESEIAQLKLQEQNAYDAAIILRDKDIKKKEEELEEMVFRNELLMQQIADLSKKIQKKDEDFKQQSKQWDELMDSMKSQMESGLRVSLLKIQELQSELEKERQRKEE